LLLAQPVLLTVLLPALSPLEPPLLRAHRPLMFPPLRGPGGRPGPARRRIRSRGIPCHPLLITTIKTTPVRCKRPKGEGKPTHRRGDGEHDERPEVVIAVRHRLRLIARLALVAAYSGGRRLCSSRERANAIGSASSFISKMRSSLSMRGTIHR
jgi:hypothetical protein